MLCIAIYQLEQNHRAAVEGRNAAGLQLLDRQEELSALLEKKRALETALNNSEDDHRKLMAQQAELQRRVADSRRQHQITSKVLPRVSDLEHEV